jgi:hypothetical protein
MSNDGWPSRPFLSSSASGGHPTLSCASMSRTTEVVHALHGVGIRPVLLKGTVVAR